MMAFGPGPVLQNISSLTYILGVTPLMLLLLFCVIMFIAKKGKWPIEP
jgi:hypothetical protein